MRSLELCVFMCSTIHLMASLPGTNGDPGNHYDAFSSHATPFRTCDALLFTTDTCTNNTGREPSQLGGPL